MADPTADVPVYGRDAAVRVNHAGRTYDAVVRLVDGDRRFLRFANGNTGWVFVRDLQPAEGTDAT